MRPRATLTRIIHEGSFPSPDLRDLTLAVPARSLDVAPVVVLEGLQRLRRRDGGQLRSVQDLELRELRLTNRARLGYRLLLRVGQRLLDDPRIAVLLAQPL